jgi:hypothetical protein
MLESLITSTYQPVIAHRQLGTTTNITSCNVPNVFGTQRRRTNKLVITRSNRVLKAVPAAAPAVAGARRPPANPRLRRRDSDCRH